MVLLGVTWETPWDHHWELCGKTFLGHGVNKGIEKISNLYLHLSLNPIKGNLWKGIHIHLLL